MKEYSQDEKKKILADIRNGVTYAGIFNDKPLSDLVPYSYPPRIWKNGFGLMQWIYPNGSNESKIRLKDLNHVLYEVLAEYDEVIPVQFDMTEGHFVPLA